MKHLPWIWARCATHERLQTNGQSTKQEIYYSASRWHHELSVWRKKWNVQGTGNFMGDKVDYRTGSLWQVDSCSCLVVTREVYSLSGFVPHHPSGHFRLTSGKTLLHFTLVYFITFFLPPPSWHNMTIKVKYSIAEWSILTGDRPVQVKVCVISVISVRCATDRHYREQTVAHLPLHVVSKRKDGWINGWNKNERIRK